MVLLVSAGKDQFVSYCSEFLNGQCYNISTVDAVKSIAIYCGWDGTKTPENRKFLSNLKDILTEWNDLPYRDTIKKIGRIRREKYIDDIKENEYMIFIHVREPNELKRYADELDAITLIIRRDSVEQGEKTNHADRDVLNYQYDISIDNNGTLNDLREQARCFVADLTKV